uniref:Tight junction protein 1a n=1 Tax=Oryzias sinensis TaxID=183150 RepID=A0A8C7ZP48_9TELE
KVHIPAINLFGSCRFTVRIAAGFGFGIAISGGRDNPHFQSGETSIVISDVLKGGPAEGLLQENDRVVMVNAVSMDNVEHSYAVKQLRNSGKVAKITIRRKRKMQLPVSRSGDRETMSEREEDTDEEDGYDHRGRSGQNAYGVASGSLGRHHDRERSSSAKRDHSASREMSVSPRSDRRSQTSSAPLKPAKVTLVKIKALGFLYHIFVKDISPESLAARDGNIQEGDVVLKINGTVTENLSLTDAKKLIERSKGKLKMVVQRDERATLLNIPDLDDSIPSANNSDRDGGSNICWLFPALHLKSFYWVLLSYYSELMFFFPFHRSRDEDRISKLGAIPSSAINLDDGASSQASDQGSSRDDKQLPPLPEPKPVYAQPGQPDVDLPVSPTDAPVPSAAHDDSILRPSMKLVTFKKGESVGLRLAGGNDVGIFVAGVLEDSPAAKEGLEEGDQILRVNNVDFANIIREEAVLFLLDLPRGEEITILAQKKKDVYRRIVESDVGDSFYIRTHFEYEKESPYGLSFNKGEVFRVVDTLYNGKLGSWLAIRIGKNHQEVERGIIPNKNRAEQLSSVQYTLPKTPGGDRADFWRFRGLRSSKRNLRKSREDLSAQPVQTKFPAYERVVLREGKGSVWAGTKSTLLMRSEPRDAGTDQKSSGIIRLHTIKQIIDQDKHAVLDITPNAVDRLNYAQWYPIVVFLNPDSKQGVKTMRTRLCPESRKSARKLFDRALKLRKNNHHLFTSTLTLNSLNDGWFGALKQSIKDQQSQLVWVSEGKADGVGDDDLDIHDDRLSYLSAPGSEYSMYSTDSRHTSDYEDTDTEGGAYTDQELDETLNDDVGPPTEPAITRSSEPVREDPPVIQEPPGYSGYQHSVQGDPLNRIDPAGFKAPAPQQVAFLRAARLPCCLEDVPEPLSEAMPPAVDVTVNTLGALSLDEVPAAPYSKPSPNQEAGSLRRPNPELASQRLTPEPLHPGLIPTAWKTWAESISPRPTVLSSYIEIMTTPPSRYDVNSSVGGFPDSKYRNYDNLPYENSVSHYDQQPWSSYNQPQHSATNPQSYDLRTPYSDSSDPQYTPPLRIDEPPPQTGFDGRPRYGKPVPQGHIRHDDLPPSFPGSDLHYNQESPLNTYPSASRSPEPPTPRLAYNQGPTMQQKGYKPHQYDPPHANSESSLTPPPKAEAPSPPRDQLPEDDPAMRPQSVLTRVKMFENKRSVSVDRARDTGDSSNKPADSPLKAGGVIPKANSLSNLDQDKAYRAPEAQRPPPKAAGEIVRPNHYDPDEDADYYRKQLSLLDKLHTGPNKPQLQAQTSQSFPRTEILEKPTPAEKKYEPIPQMTPSLPPAKHYCQLCVLIYPPNLSTAKPPAREDTVQTNFLPHKSFPEKSPVNGTGDQPPKTAPTAGAPSSFNRFVPKPFTTSAKPYTRMFDSPKFSHNLLPNDKPESAPKVNTFCLEVENEPRPKYQQNNVNAVPKAIPVSPSALEDDEEDEGHTVVATARGIFNSNGGVLSSIETGVSIIIPQGAIPDGVEQEIYFKVCRDNSILPPLDKEKGETLLSPLVMCGPHGLKFLKPVELRLPHCDPKSWQNKSLPGDPNYLVGANCVSVLIDHF